MYRFLKNISLVIHELEVGFMERTTKRLRDINNLEVTKSNEDG